MGDDMGVLVRHLNQRAIEADTRRTVNMPVTEITGVPACGDTIARIRKEQDE